MFSDDVAERFDPVPGYCNTASVGIPPRAAVEVLRGCLDAWAAATLDKVALMPMWPGPAMASPGWLGRR
jgi:hypothetical protein